MMLPTGWAERAAELGAGAPAGDWIEEAQALAAERFRKVRPHRDEPRWVPVFENGVCVRMVWHDPSVHFGSDDLRKRGG